MKLFKRMLMFSAVLLLINIAFYFYFNGSEGFKFSSVEKVKPFKPLKPFNHQPVVIDVDIDPDSPLTAEFERNYQLPNKCKSVIERQQYKEFCENHRKLTYKQFIRGR